MSLREDELMRSCYRKLGYEQEYLFGLPIPQDVKDRASEMFWRMRDKDDDDDT